MMPVYYVHRITEEWVKKSQYENNYNIGHDDHYLAHSSDGISSGL